MAESFVDPSTGRLAYSGPKGEGGFAENDPRVAELQRVAGLGIGAPGLQSYTMPDGRVAYYYPGQNIQQGNVQALATYGKTASGGSGTAADDAAKNAVANQNALGYIQGLLEQYGLGSLAGQMWPLVQQGYDANYIMQQIRTTPEFKARFPAIALREKNGLTPLSPADYVNLESQYDSAIHQTGLTGMFDRTDLYTKWIGGDVSASEVHDRAQAAYQAALGEPLDVRAELTRLYGNDASGIATAYFLDPSNSLPKIQQRIQAGEIAGSSNRTGFGLLTRDEAENLASQGVSGQQAQAGFGDLASKQELFTGLIGSNESAIDRQSQLNAEFSGDQAAQQQIEQRAGLRRAVVNSGAQFGVGRTGVSGLGSGVS